MNGELVVGVALIVAAIGVLVVVYRMTGPEVAAKHRALLLGWGVIAGLAVQTGVQRLLEL